jgi:hypothetical protein
MPRNISFSVDVSVFKLTLHNVEIILNDRWHTYLDKVNTGSIVTISIDKFKDSDGDSFPSYKRPSIIEIKAKEGSFKIDMSEIR